MAAIWQGNFMAMLPQTIAAASASDAITGSPWQAASGVPPDCCKLPTCGGMKARGWTLIQACLPHRRTA